MKKVLVRNGRHQRPLFVVLKRYGIGQRDEYDRGLWITEADLPIIEEHMATDATLHAYWWNGKTIPLVNGTNIHNDVSIADFKNLFV